VRWAPHRSLGRGRIVVTLGNRQMFDQARTRGEARSLRQLVRSRCALGWGWRARQPPVAGGVHLLDEARRRTHFARRKAGIE